MAACAPTLKKLTLELAGNDAAIVCPDVDIDEVVAKSATGSFFNAGQMCVATKRIYVHEDIYDEFLAKFVAEVKDKYRIVRDGDVPTVFGPVSNKLQFDIVQKMLADAEKRGIKMESFEEGVPEKGYWVPATVLVNPPEDALVVQEEQFGKSITLFFFSFSLHHTTDNADIPYRPYHPHSQVARRGRRFAARQSR